MVMLETPRSLARHGGWKVMDGSSHPVCDPAYRHFGVTISAPFEVFLPHAQLANQTPILALGTQVHIHNLSASQALTISVAVSQSAPLFTTHSLPAGKSCSFVLLGYDPSNSRCGVWLMYETDSVAVTNIPTVPDGFLVKLTLTASRNNFNLLSEAVARGYDGTIGALAIVTLQAGTIIGSDSVLSPAFDTGGDSPVAGVNWHASSKLFLRVESMDDGIHGCGGRGGGGGVGGTGAAAGQPGLDGGIAVRAAFSLTVYNAGHIAGGCGGGGGGDGKLTTAGCNGGGAGGGAGADCRRSGVIVGGKGGNKGGTGAFSGQDGTLLAGGYFGTGSTFGGFSGGRGGLGGSYSGSWVPGAGGAGRQFNDTGNSTGGLGGAAGAAISRKSTATVTIHAGSTGFIGGATIVV